MKVAICTRVSTKDKGQDVENQRRFGLLEDLQEHQETCETALAIDPADAAEELAMWAAEELTDEGLAPDPLPDFDPFAGEREGENWQ